MTHRNALPKAPSPQEHFQTEPPSCRKKPPSPRRAAHCLLQPARSWPKARAARDSGRIRHQYACGHSPVAAGSSARKSVVVQAASPAPNLHQLRRRGRHIRRCCLAATYLTRPERWRRVRRASKEQGSPLASYVRARKLKSQPAERLAGRSSRPCEEIPSASTPARREPFRSVGHLRIARKRGHQSRA